MSNFRKIILGISTFIAINMLSTTNCFAMKENSSPKKEATSNEEKKEDNLKDENNDDLSDSLFEIDINKDNSFKTTVKNSDKNKSSNKILNKKTKKNMFKTKINFNIENSNKILDKKTKKNMFKAKTNFEIKDLGYLLLKYLYIKELENELTKKGKDEKIYVNTILKDGFSKYHKDELCKDAEVVELKVTPYIVISKKKNYYEIRLTFANKNIDTNTIELCKKIIREYLNTDISENENIKNKSSDLTKIKITKKDVLLNNAIDKIKKIYEELKSNENSYSSTYRDVLNLMDTSTLNLDFKKGLENNYTEIISNLYADITKYEDVKTDIRDSKSIFKNYFELPFKNAFSIKHINYENDNENDNKNDYEDIDAKEIEKIANKFISYLFKEKIENNLTERIDDEIKVNKILKEELEKYNKKNNNNNNINKNIKIMKLGVNCSFFYLENDKSRYLCIINFFTNSDIDDENTENLYRDIILEYINPYKVQQRCKWKCNIQLRNETAVEDTIIKDIIKNIETSHKEFSKDNKNSKTFDRLLEITNKSKIEKSVKNKIKNNKKKIIDHLYKTYCGKEDNIKKLISKIYYTININNTQRLNNNNNNKQNENEDSSLFNVSESDIDNCYNYFVDMLNNKNDNDSNIKDIPVNIFDDMNSNNFNIKNTSNDIKNNDKSNMNNVSIDTFNDMNNNNNNFDIKDSPKIYDHFYKDDNFDE